MPVKLLPLITFITVIFAQIDTTYVSCPPAGTNLEYGYSDYTLYSGDETALEIISHPDWTTVILEMQDYMTYTVLISGTPGEADLGINEIVVGWFEWNFANNEQELIQIFIFNILVENSCCGNPLGCNYTPEGCITNGDYCFYNCGCTDSTAFNYDPYADWDNSSCEYCTPGDFNDDETLDILDLVKLVGFILSAIPPTELELCRGDVNGDGDVDISDILQLIEEILQSSEIVSLSFGMGVPGCMNNYEGWCYCENVYSAAGTSVTLTNLSHCGGPDVTLSGFIPFASWQALLPDVNREYILSLNDIYGTPGSDAPFEWITVEFEDTTKTVWYEFDISMYDELEDLIPLRNALQDISMPLRSEIRCITPPDIGPCDGLCPRYYYNTDSGQCEVFYWGCCQGTVPFETLEECQSTCEEE